MKCVSAVWLFRNLKPPAAVGIWTFPNSGRFKAVKGKLNTQTHYERKFECSKHDSTKRLSVREVKIHPALSQKYTLTMNPPPPLMCPEGILALCWETRWWPSAVRLGSFHRRSQWVAVCRTSPPRTRARRLTPAELRAVSCPSSHRSTSHAERERERERETFIRHNSVCYRLCYEVRTTKTPVRFFLALWEESV